MQKDKKYTPRQRCAIAHPVRKKEGYLHPRYWRRNGDFQSVLTFDLFDAEDVPEKFKEQTSGGQVGIWHGRIWRCPEALAIGDWTAEDLSKAQKMMMRLVNKVGMYAHEAVPGKDNASVHVFRWGTITEVAMALRAIEGKKQ